MISPQSGAGHPDDATLADYHDGTLSPAQNGAVTDHIAGCAQCQATLAKMERSDEALRSLPLLEPPGDVRQRVLQEVERAGRSWFIPDQGIGRVAVAGVLAILLLAVGFGLLRHNLGQDHQSSGPQIAAPAAPTRINASALAPGGARPPTIATARRVAPRPTMVRSVGVAPRPTRVGTQDVVPAPKVVSTAGARLAPTTIARRETIRPLPLVGGANASLASSTVAVTASIGVTTTSRVRATTALARKVTVLYGGSLISTRSVGTRTVLIIRVPARRFQTLLDSLVALPKIHVKSKVSHRRDLTSDLAALQARATRLRATQTRLRAALKVEHGAVSPSTTRRELTAVEKSLALVQTHLDADNQSVAFSTIVVSIASA